MYMPAYGLMYHVGVASEFMTVARLRAEMADVLERLGHDGPLYLTQRGKPRAVLLDIDEYRVLIEQLGHLDDSLEALLARERRETGEGTSRPLADVTRKGRAAAPSSCWGLPSHLRSGRLGSGHSRDARPSPPRGVPQAAVAGLFVPAPLAISLVGGCALRQKRLARPHGA